MARKPADRESYKGYELILPSHDWDALYEVWKDGKKLHAVQDRSDARKWIDKQLAQAQPAGGQDGAQSKLG